MPEESILPIDHPLLSRPSEVIEQVDEDVRELAAEMFRVMNRAHGAGLAAVQVGRLVRLVVVDGPDAEGTWHRLPLVNPRIVAASARIVVGEEGCLPLLDYLMPVPRHDRVEVASQDLDGREAQLVASGSLAVCVQHEVDHTDGVLFWGRVSRLRRQRAKQHVRKVRRQHEAALRLG